ncbi:hypothetical protein ACVSUB_16905 [Yersinia enterocolitica]
MLMSKSAYAKYKGVSRQTVYDWIEKGEVVVIDGKIDVGATEHQQQAALDDNTPWPRRTLHMTWGECWEVIKSNDCKFPAPTTDEEIQQWVTDAAEELGWGVEFLEGGGIKLNDGEGVHYFEKYDFLENAHLAISLLRHDFCYVADNSPDEEDDWSPEGIKALSLRA